MKQRWKTKKQHAEIHSELSFTWKKKLVASNQQNPMEYRRYIAEMLARCRASDKLSGSSFLCYVIEIIVVLLDLSFCREGVE